MPTPTLSTISIVSPSPNPLTTRSFTVANFTPITEYAFKFATHHQSPTLEASLNNTYLEKFDDANTVSFFTDAARTLVDSNTVTKIRNAIINSIDSYSQANRTIIASIINIIIIFTMVGKPQQRYPLRSTLMLTTALTTTLVMNQNYLIVYLNTTSLSIAPTHNPITFSGISTFVIVSNANLAAAPTVAAAANISQATSSQVAVAAAATTIAATLPSVFDSRNLPVDVRARYDTFHYPTDILTNKAMVQFFLPTGGCGPILSYLDSPLGAGVKSSPIDSNRIIAGQFSLC